MVSRDAIVRVGSISKRMVFGREILSTAVGYGSLGTKGQAEFGAPQLFQSNDLDLTDPLSGNAE